MESKYTPMKAEGSIRKRKSNWTTEETFYLAKVYQEHANLLKADFNKPGCTAKKKQEAWENIVVKLEETYPDGNQDVKDCQKCWQTIKSAARPRIAEYYKAVTGTGGGPAPPPLSKLDELIADILGSENVSLGGCSDKCELLIHSDSLIENTSNGETAAAAPVSSSSRPHDHKCSNFPWLSVH